MYQLDMRFEQKTMKRDSERDKLKEMEEMSGMDMNELLPHETEKYFYLIR